MLAEFQTLLIKYQDNERKWNFKTLLAKLTITWQIWGLFLLKKNVLVFCTPAQILLIKRCQKKRFAKNKKSPWLHKHASMNKTYISYWSDILQVFAPSSYHRYNSTNKTYVNLILFLTFRRFRSGLPCILYAAILWRPLNCS